MYVKLKFLMKWPDHDGSYVDTGKCVYAAIP